jgi:exopolyphosphatase/guanosine-5'-triphosphate,3'-diphosphate pyrophosphatase
MELMRRAVIDVGTNSIKLLVADVAGRDVRPVHEESRQTRLGQGFYQTRQLQPESIARTAEAVREFSEIAREQAAQSIRVIATSAARDAMNAADLTRAIERASGLQTEIISGTREAEWVFQGVATGVEFCQRPLLLLDVGGGSTEFILGHGAQRSFAHSFPLGTVRLMEQFPPGDPPSAAVFNACRDWLRQFLLHEIRPQLAPALKHEPGEILLVGTGGTTTLLACVENQLDRFDRGVIESTVLTFDRVKALREKFWGMSLARRKEIAGLPRQRADVILTGVLIYELVMEEFGFEQVRISTRGLRFAAVMEPPPAA